MQYLLLLVIIFAWSLVMKLAFVAMNYPSDLAFYGGVLFALAFTITAARALVYVLRKLI